MTARDLARRFEERRKSLPPVLVAFRREGTRLAKASRRASALASLLERIDSK